MIDLLFAAGLCLAVDGDTLRCGEHRIRLHGIDAPERRDPGGEASKRYLASIIEGAGIRCAPKGRDRYGRTVAVCYVDRLAGGWFQKPGGYSLNCMMVRARHARDWPKYSGGAYADCLP